MMTTHSWTTTWWSINGDHYKPQIEEDNSYDDVDANDVDDDHVYVDDYWLYIYILLLLLRLLLKISL